MSICPCQRQQIDALDYAQCCQPLHQGQPVPSYQQLMRSRFSAYVMGLNDYLKQTWHPNTCPDALDVEADNQWLKLDIVSAQGNQVHFKAYGKDEDGFFCLEEISNFTEHQGGKVYIDGQVTMKPYTPERNAPCLCGSGKKYKKCCG